MKSHIALKAKSGYLAMKPDASLTITEKNPMFNDVEMFSQTFQLPLDKNRHLMKNIEDLNSTLRASDVNGERIGVIVDGIPMRNATMKVQDDVVIDNSIDVNLDATNRTFKDMIQDLKCRDVEVDDDILIGEKIGDVNVNVVYQPVVNAYVDSSGTGAINPCSYRINLNPIVINETFQPFANGFSYPAECYENAETHEAYPAQDEEGKTRTKTYQNPDVTVNIPKVKESYINVSQPYPLKKYCNSKIAYAHHDAEYNSESKIWESKDDIIKADKRQRGVAEDKSPYWVLDADRPASGICFYVAYFLECLFKKLGVAYDMTALTNIEDFNYLAFFSTQCHYDTRGIDAEHVLSSEDEINKWLTSRGCGGKFSLNLNVPTTPYSYYDNNIFKLDIPMTDVESWSVEGQHGSYHQYVSTNLAGPDGIIRIGNLSYWNQEPYKYVPNTGIKDFERWMYAEKDYEVKSYAFSAKILRMYANADNFPDADVRSVIESLESSFGVRFCYDADKNKVTVKLLRDMFRDTTAPIKFKGRVTSFRKKIEDIRGIRMRYSAESDAKEQSDNIRYGKRDYDTTYNYMDYPDGRTQISSYEDLTEKIDIGNRNGYADLNTGDFYRIKVAADASSTDELQPAVFEVGQYKGVEMGDCSKQAEDDGTIKEFVSQFEPVIVNDVDYRGKNYEGEEHQPMLVPFVDEDMEHEFIPVKVLNPISTKYGNIEVSYDLCLCESYDPSQTDDGQSPLQSHDWGLTVGFLRPGSGSIDVVDYDPNYDGFGNSKWYLTSEDYSFTADSFDAFGNFIGINPANSFSLKPRAWKPFLYYIDRDGKTHVTTDLSKVGQRVNDTPGHDYYWMIPCNDDERDEQGIITKRLRSRGMCDTWMIEFFKFLLNRQRYEIEAISTAAELADIPNRWLRRFNIDGKIGWINQYEYSVDELTGIGKVKIDFFAL